MPRVNAATDGGFSQGDFADTGYEDVAAYLSSFPNVHFYKGFFPDSAIGKEPEKQNYRFVHLDLGYLIIHLQQAWIFLPATGGTEGTIVSQDYLQPDLFPGVKKALDDFFWRYS